jgi:2-dehydro-3-deoxyphosphogluconate aldolase / (4S)-4-hydroxy-2-oxoglutarate aldolase
MTTEEFVDELRRHGVMAVVRGASAEAAAAAATALAEGGVRAIEVAYTVPQAADALRSLAGQHELLLGAGTVLTTAQAREAVAAGARYLVAPNFDPTVADAAASLGVPLLAGVLTPTEVAVAMPRCPVLKLFPANIAGPAYLRALRGPFPALRAVPTGGVRADNIAEWLDAGALAVGAGSDLCPPTVVDAGDLVALRLRAAAYSRALRHARA